MKSVNQDLKFTTEDFEKKSQFTVMQSREGRAKLEPIFSSLTSSVQLDHF
jgi:hypothetical protein